MLAAVVVHRCRWKGSDEMTMNEFIFNPYEPKPQTYRMYIFRQEVAFTKHDNVWNGKLQFDGKEHLLLWSVNPTQMFIDGVQIPHGESPLSVFYYFMQGLASLHKLTAWQQYDNGFEGFDTYSSEHLIYSVAGLDFYAETSMDDTCWRYITNADDHCHHASRWFNGMDFKPCLHHFRHWVNASISNRIDDEKNI
jgi:hypothetical protein